MRKKMGKHYGLFALFLLLLLGVPLTGSAEARVQLLGWRDINPSLIPNGSVNKAGTYEYVVFGQFANNPILWRVLRADQGGIIRRGYLFSENTLGSSMAFDGGGSNNYGRSSIRTYLVSDDTTGFYVPANFSAAEKTAIVEQSLTTTAGDGSDSVTTDNPMFLLSSTDLTEPDYGFSGMLGTDVNRGALDTAGNRGHYWTRSPTTDLVRVWGINSVRNGGYHFGLSADRTDLFIRPACFLNLDSFLFKSAFNDFTPGSSSGGEGGSRQNPFVLLLPGQIPTGAPAGWTTRFASEDKIPEIAKIDGKFLTLEWGTAISPAVKNWPAPDDFMLLNGERPFKVASHKTNKNMLVLTFEKGVKFGESVRISYNLDTDAISFDSTGDPIKIVNSFLSLIVSNDTLPIPNTPNVTPTQARFDGLSPEDLKFLLSGAALTAANAGNLSITVETPEGTVSFAAGDYSVESRNLTIFKNFLSQLRDGTHTVYLHNDTAQVGKITLVVTNSSGSDTKDSGSSGCNAGVGASAFLLLLGGMAVLRKKD